MFDIKRILVPIDRSQLSRAALPIAESLAKQYGATVVLVSVAETNEEKFLYASGMGSPVGTAMVPELFEETEDAMLDSTRRALQHARQTLSDQGVDVEAHLAEGDATEAVTDITRGNHPDLIVIASHARSGLARTFMGSLADHLVRETDVPVLIVTADSAPEES